MACDRCGSKLYICLGGVVVIGAIICAAGFYFEYFGGQTGTIKGGCDMRNSSLKTLAMIGNDSKTLVAHVEVPDEKGEMRNVQSRLEINPKGRLNIDTIESVKDTLLSSNEQHVAASYIDPTTSSLAVIIDTGQKIYVKVQARYRRPRHIYQILSVPNPASIPWKRDPDPLQDNLTWVPSKLVVGAFHMPYPSNPPPLYIVQRKYRQYKRKEPKLRIRGESLRKWIKGSVDSDDGEQGTSEGCFKRFLGYGDNGTKPRILTEGATVLKSLDGSPKDWLLVAHELLVKNPQEERSYHYVGTYELGSESDAVMAKNPIGINPISDFVKCDKYKGSWCLSGRMDSVVGNYDAGSASYNLKVYRGTHYWSTSEQIAQGQQITMKNPEDLEPTMLKGNTVIDEAMIIDCVAGTNYDPFGTCPSSGLLEITFNQEMNNTSPFPDFVGVIDALWYHQSELTIYLFSGDYYYTYKRESVNTLQLTQQDKSLIADSFPGLARGGIEAALSIISDPQSSNQALLFRGNYFWRVTSNGNKQFTVSSPQFVLAQGPDGNGGFFRWNDQCHDVWYDNVYELMKKLEATAYNISPIPEGPKPTEPPPESDWNIQRILWLIGGALIIIPLMVFAYLKCKKGRGSPFGQLQSQLSKAISAQSVKGKGSKKSRASLNEKRSQKQGASKTKSKTKTKSLRSGPKKSKETTKSNKKKGKN